MVPQKQRIIHHRCKLSHKAFVKLSLLIGHWHAWGVYEQKSWITLTVSTWCSVKCEMPTDTTSCSHHRSDDRWSQEFPLGNTGTWGASQREEALRADTCHPPAPPAIHLSSIYLLLPQILGCCPLWTWSPQLQGYTCDPQHSASELVLSCYSLGPCSPIECWLLKAEAVLHVRTS